MSEELPSKRENHVLQTDEKISLIFEMLRRWTRSQYPAAYEQLKQDWLEGKIR